MRVPVLDQRLSHRAPPSSTWPNALRQSTKTLSSVIISSRGATELPHRIWEALLKQLSFKVEMRDRPPFQEYPSDPEDDHLATAIAAVPVRNRFAGDWRIRFFTRSKEIQLADVRRGRMQKQRAHDIPPLHIARMAPFHHRAMVVLLQQLA